MQLQNELQEIQSRSNVEIHNLKEQQIAALAQLQHQINLFKNDIAQKEDVIRNHQVIISIHFSSLLCTTSCL